MREINRDDKENVLLYCKTTKKIYLKLSNNPKQRFIGEFKVIKINEEEETVLVLHRKASVHYNRNYRSFGISKMLVQSLNKCKTIIFVIDGITYKIPVTDLLTFLLTHNAAKNLSYGFEEQYFIPFEKLKHYRWTSNGLVF